MDRPGPGARRVRRTLEVIQAGRKVSPGSRHLSQAELGPCAFPVGSFDLVKQSLRLVELALGKKDLGQPQPHGRLRRQFHGPAQRGSFPLRIGLVEDERLQVRPARVGGVEAFCLGQRRDGVGEEIVGEQDHAEASPGLGRTRRLHDGLACLGNGLGDLRVNLGRVHGRRFGREDRAPEVPEARRQHQHADEAGGQQPPPPAGFPGPARSRPDTDLVGVLHPPTSCRYASSPAL